MEDRYYPKDEWNRLTQEQCNKVTEMARERKKRAGDSAYSKRKTATAERERGRKREIERKRERKRLREMCFVKTFSIPIYIDLSFSTK